jgi:hypothetical protein
MPNARCISSSIIPNVDRASDIFLGKSIWKKSFKILVPKTDKNIIIGSMRLLNSFISIAPFDLLYILFYKQ